MGFVEAAAIIGAVGSAASGIKSLTTKTPKAQIPEMPKVEAKPIEAPKAADVAPAVATGVREEAMRRGRASQILSNQGTLATQDAGQNVVRKRLLGE